MATESGRSSAVSKEELLELLLRDIDLPIAIINESKKQVVELDTWGKSLSLLPAFTIKEIEEHRLRSGKTPESSIIKTLDRGRKFKNERYLTSDSVSTKWDEQCFYLKCQCKASMKKEKRDVSVALCRSSGKVSNAKCSCPAGLSGYCNHIMAFLLEVADYSLNQLPNVPEEISCTSRLRQWGVPGEVSNKAPVMDTVIQSQTTSRGISSTLYDPRRDKDTPQDSLNLMQAKLQERDKKIGFACCVPPVGLNQEEINTKFGQFVVGSPLSFHLNPVGFTTKVETNINKIKNPLYSEHDYTELPLLFIKDENELVPKDWVNTPTEQNYLNSIKISREKCRLLETDTVSQSKNELWKLSKKWKIGSSEAHKVFIRKKNLSLVDIFLSPKEEQDLPYAVRENFKHGKLYEPIAREKYEHVMQFYLNRDVEVRETGCVIQPNLFWLVASPDGLVSD